jgi:hypothetical protein
MFRFFRGRPIVPCAAVDSTIGTRTAFGADAAAAATTTATAAAVTATAAATDIVAAIGFFFPRQVKLDLQQLSQMTPSDRPRTQRHKVTHINGLERDAPPCPPTPPAVAIHDAIPSIAMVPNTLVSIASEEEGRGLAQAQHHFSQ